MIKKVFVVDDELSIVSVIVYVFWCEGYEVEIVNDGEEVLVKVVLFYLQVMILDVMMLRFDGYGVCCRLEDCEDIGIILLIVKNDIVDKIVGLEMGVDDYMIKLFNFMEFVVWVNFQFCCFL